MTFLEMQSNLPSGQQIKAQTPISLPLWLSTLLAVQRLGPASQPICTLDLPHSLAPRVLNALRADPRTVDLRSLTAHYYDLAARVLELFEEEEIVDILAETFKKRAADIADHAHNLRGAQSEGADFLRGLDFMEEQLFRAAHESSKAMRLWMGEIKKKV